MRLFLACHAHVAYALPRGHSYAIAECLKVNSSQPVIFCQGHWTPKFQVLPKEARPFRRCWRNHRNWMKKCCAATRANIKHDHSAALSHRNSDTTMCHLLFYCRRLIFLLLTLLLLYHITPNLTRLPLLKNETWPCF